jgi:hypothetical protein
VRKVPRRGLALYFELFKRQVSKLRSYVPDSARILAKNAPNALWPRIKLLNSPDPDNADAALLLLGMAALERAHADILRRPGLTAP